MAIHFDRSRLETVINSHEAWWLGELDRPLLRCTITDYYPPLPGRELPVLSQANCHDFSRSAEEIIEAEDRMLSRFEYLGDAYPVMDFASFGPGVLAAFCGSTLDNSRGQVWFLPCEPDITNLHVKYDPENKWARRIKELYRAGLERWQGAVIMTLPDLGGIMDILASLIGAENLVFALVDEPEEVKRVQKEIQAAWYEAYADFSNVLKPQGVNTNWNGILSRTPSYIPQCDFSYMLGQDMFREFVLEHLRTDTQRLDRTIYHLDGIGALKHLDALLELEELTAIQWVYGVDQPGPEAWIDVYNRITDAGKQIMIIENALHNGYGKVLPQLKTRSPYACIWATRNEMEEAKKLLSLR